MRSSAGLAIAFARSSGNSCSAFSPPVIELRSLVAERDIVTAEGFVRNHFKGGGEFKGLFHNVYRFRDGKICRMTSYVVPLPESGWDHETTR